MTSQASGIPGLEADDKKLGDHGAAGSTATDTPARPSRQPSTLNVAIVVCGLVLIAAIIGGAAIISSRRDGHTRSASTSVAAASTRPTTTRTSKPATFAPLFAADSSGVVRINSTTCSGADLGTGFLVAPDLIATAAHVVEGSAGITLHAAKSASVGTVVGIDSVSDVALLRSQTRLTGHVFTLAPRSPAVGTPVATIGFPDALPITLTQGTVSGLRRSGSFKDGITRHGLIQTDAPVNPGNSGGPLVKTDGSVVGLVEGDLTGANGIAYATGVDVARPLLQGWQRVPQTVPLASCGTPKQTAKAATRLGGRT